VGRIRNRLADAKSRAASGRRHLSAVLTLTVDYEVERGVARSLQIQDVANLEISKIS
jgi:hypothetical protein